MTAGPDAPGGPDGIRQPPPFWGKWSRLYWLVAGALIADVVLGWLLTRWAS